MEKKKSTIKVSIKGSDGSDPVVSDIESDLILKDFAVHPAITTNESKDYAVTHIGSGFYIFHAIPFKSIACKVCRQLQVLVNMGVIEKDFIEKKDPDLIAWIKAVRVALLQSRKANDI